MCYIFDLRTFGVKWHVEDSLGLQSFNLV